MSVAFYKGQVLGREDLNIYFTNASGRNINAAEISYAIYDVTTGLEALVGVPRRTPANPSIGEYYASIIIPVDANLGSYRVRWTFRESFNAPIQQVVQEFEVIDKMTSSALTSPGFTQIEADLIRRLRILTRDHNPDRNYHFRPPAHEETVRQFNRVFGFIWEDTELQEYLERSLDMISAAPPRTPFSNIDMMVRQRPEWRTLLLTGAMSFALNALRLNWIADEFSLEGSTEVRVRLPDGRELDVTLEELYARRTEFGTLQVRSAQLDGAVEWRPISNVMKHATGHKKAFRVSCDGVSVVATEDHSLFAFSGGLETVQTSKVSPGMPLAIARGDCVSGSPVSTVIEVNPLVESYDLSVPGPENFILSNGIVAHNSYSIGGVSLDLEKSSKYEGAYQSATDQFDKQLEKAKATINVIRGLQQPKFGMGIRSAFGPYVGAGVLSPRKWVGGG